MRYIIALFLLSLSTFSSGQTELMDAKKIWVRDSIRLGTNWIRSVSRDTALLTVTDRDIPSAKAVKEFVLNRWNNGLVPWGNVTGKPSLLISGNNLADVSNVATARTNLSVYSIATVNDSLLNHFTKSQSDARFKSIDWFPTVANVTGLPDSLTNLQARIQTKLTKTDADTYYPAIQRMLDSLTAVQARVQTKEPFISPGTSAQYWRGDKSWQTLDKSAVGLSAVPNVDATNPANISQSELYRFVTDTEKSTWNAKQSALGYTPENAANKGIANGYADLDAGGKIPASRIDFGQTGQTFVVASQSAMLAVSGANIGALAIRTDENKNYRLIAQPASTLANWQVLLSPDAPVQSVNGFTGNVNLLTTHISEGSNYWWTAARSRAAQSLTVSGSSGSATYDNTTGVLNIPTYTLAGLGGQPALSGTGFVKISGTTITYDNSTYLTSYTETDPTIYAWAKATTKPSYSWGEITGTVPTWNQNTTGNAATATTTNNWGGNTLGGASSSAPNYLFGAYAGGNAYYSDQTAVRAFLALGSYAYRSSGLAELSGANFTGSVLVENGSFFQAKRNTGSAVVNVLGFESGTDDLIQVFSSSFKLRNTGIGDAANMFTVSVSGNGTFTGSSTATAFIRNGGTSSQFLKADGSIDNNSYATTSSLSGYVDLTTSQTISGAKTLSSNLVGTNARFGGTITAGATTGLNTNLGNNYLDFQNNGSYSVGTVYSSGFNFNNGGGTVASISSSGDITSRAINLTDGFGVYVANFQLGGITSNRFYIYNNTLGLDNITIAPATGITTFAREISGTSLSMSGAGSFGGAVSGTSATFTGNGLFGPIITAQGTNPYFQWNNAAGSRLSYIQHATNLVYNTDVGSHVFNQAVTAAGVTVSAGNNVTIAQGELQIQSNLGFGILSSNGSRAIAITNTLVTSNYATTIEGAFTVNNSATIGGLAQGNSGFRIPNGQYYQAIRNSSGAVINMLGFEAGTDNLIQVFSDQWKLRNTGTGDAANMVVVGASGNMTVTGSTTSTGFIKSGSSDSYLLTGGGGHVAASTYATTSDLSLYVNMTGNQYEIAGEKTFLSNIATNGKMTAARILGSTASYSGTATISSTITTAFCTGNSYTLTMPSASGVTGQIMTVISNSNLTGITLSGVEGGSYTLICNSSLVLVSNGTTWKIASVYQNSGACS